MKLSVDERDEVDRHVEQGVDLMAPLLTDAATADIIRHHHEKFDGTGYPDGLAGARIPHGSRLLAVIDAWFSLTRARPFRARLAAADALAEITSHTGTQFDPSVVDAFASVLAETGILPPGSAANPD
jgi:HD-GYP domain-containing protein (c-di-GMP phosphodiesterase class II)